MAAVLYLVICCLAGSLLQDVLLNPEACRKYRMNRIWVSAAVSFGTGVLVCTWALYFIAFLLHVQGKAKNPLLPANVVLMAMAGAAAVLFHIRRRRKRAGAESVPWVLDKRLFLKECVFYAVLLVLIQFTMSFVFHQSGDSLFSGFTVFGDYAPHTAMIRSFSKSANFPTQYPHFGGADIKYHFMFQFLVGNLEFLGLRLDIAYNLVSTLSLLGFLIMICQMAYRISGKFSAAVLTPVFFFARSGTAVFRFVFEHFRTGDLMEVFRNNTAFIGYTPNEDWGLWNYNVYLNQRHLGFGLLIAAAAVWFFMDSFEAGISHEEKGAAFLKGRFITPEAWKTRGPEKSLLLGMILGLCSFWNGAAVIGCLLILCGMAVFSDGKLDYLITAVLTVAFSFIETRIFIFGNAVSPSVYWGFLSENKSIPGILWYLVQIAGITIAGLIPALFLMRRRERTLSFAFVLPTVFAFMFSLTPDINVNHKYIIISMAFLSVIWGVNISRLISGNRSGEKKTGIPAGIRYLLAGCLIFLLTATGIYDFVVIIRDNDVHHRVAVSMESSLTDWLSENLTEQDLVLTPEYSINEVTMSGCMMYMGWPYYAWSAGYDTFYRAQQGILIYQTDDADVLQETVRREKITYIIYEEGMTYEENECREDVIASVYPEVYRSDDGRIRIYRTAPQNAR